MNKFEMEEYSDSSSDSLEDLEEDDDVEDREDYHYGGYHDVKIGEIFNKKYKVVQKLGWGHFSTVWLVEFFRSKNSTNSTDTFASQDLKREQPSNDERIQEYGALKVIRSAQKYTETARDEIEILKTISKNDPTNSHYCLHLLDQFQHRGLNGIHMCIVTNVCGSNLLSLIRLFHYKGIPLEITKTISKQVLIALDFLHTRCSLIHTDIKPENVLLNFRIGKNFIKRRNEIFEIENIHVTLADFGNANWIEKRFTNDIQTRQYRCPEVMLGLHWGCPADIWSHACMIFELLTGDFLFCPRQSHSFGKMDDHFAQFIELLGPIPVEMVNSSPFKKKYFKENCELKKIDKSSLMPWPLDQILMKKYHYDENLAQTIKSLLLPMLDYNENTRATAAECLKHTWFNE